MEFNSEKNDWETCEEQSSPKPWGGWGRGSAQHSTGLHDGHERVSLHHQGLGETGVPLVGFWTTEPSSRRAEQVRNLRSRWAWIPKGHPQLGVDRPGHMLTARVSTVHKSSCQISPLSFDPCDIGFGWSSQRGLRGPPGKGYYFYSY